MEIGNDAKFRCYVKSPEGMHQMAIKRRAIRLCRAIIYGPSVWRCTGAPLEVPNPNRFLCPPFSLRQGRVRERWESPRVAFLVAARLFPRSQWIHCEPGIGGLPAGLSEPFPARLSSFGGLVCSQDFQKFLNVQGGCEELKAKPEGLDSLWTGEAFEHLQKS